MNDLFLIVILVLIIAIIGDNSMVRSVCALGVLLVFISTRIAPPPVAVPAPAEKFTIVNDLPNQDIEFADYSNFATMNPKLRMLNDRLALQELQRGTQAEQIHRGMQKNRVNYMRPFFEEEMQINEAQDWWNNERTFGDCI